MVKKPLDNSIMDAVDTVIRRCLMTMFGLPVNSLTARMYATRLDIVHFGAIFEYDSEVKKA